MLYAWEQIFLWLVWTHAGRRLLAPLIAGPEGCNLFVFHIPNDMTNRDLFNYFTSFGTVISARIMVERETGRSRGFGFVSFDNAKSAQAAIAAMDGFQIGRKRLKVKYKQDRDNADQPDYGANSIERSSGPTRGGQRGSRGRGNGRGRGGGGRGSASATAATQQNTNASTSPPQRGGRGRRGAPGRGRGRPARHGGGKGPKPQATDAASHQQS